MNRCANERERPRSFLPSRAAAVLLAVLVAGFEPARAGGQAVEPATAAESGGDAGEAAEDALREKTVYVPYEKLSEVFEKEGRGIFLPYKEFLELWQRAQPRPTPPEDPPPPAEAVLSGGEYRGAVEEDLARFDVTYRVSALKKKGWSVLRLALADAAVERAAVVQVDAQSAPPDRPPLFVGEAGQFAAFFPAAGAYEIHLKLAVPVETRPGTRSLGFRIPAAATSTLDLRIPEENPQIDVRPATAATEVTVEDSVTRVVAYLGNATEVGVSWSPPVGRIQEQEALLRAQQRIHAHLGERVLRITTTVDMEILSQEVSRFRVRVPEGLQVISVEGENLRDWKLEEGEGLLELRLHSPVKQSYTYRLAFERILDQTPDVQVVTFPRIEGVLREKGHVALSYDGSLRVRVSASEGLSQLDRSELPDDLEGRAMVGFRYLAHPLSVTLDVEKILPVVHSNSTSVVIFGQEEDSWVGWVDFRISRAGIFSRQIVVPARWRVDSLGDEGTVEDYQSAPLAGDATFQVINVNLKSRAFGQFRLPFRFTAEGSARPGENTVHAPRTLDVESDRGLLGIGGPRSFSLTTVSQERTISADVQELFRSGVLNRIPQEADASLAFTFNEQPALVSVRLESRKTEIKVTSRLLIDVRESEIDMKLDMDYLIQYAAVDRLAFSAPASLDDRLIDVKVVGYKEHRKTETVDDRSIWEISLQSKVLNIVTVTIPLQEDLKGLAVGDRKQVEIPVIRAESLERAEVRNQVGTIAIRKDGELEILTPEDAVENLEVINALDLPPGLALGRINKAFKFVQPDWTLTLELIRHRYEKLASAVVTLLQVKSQLSTERELTSTAVMELQNTDLQKLDLRLPAGSALLNTVVNGRRVTPHMISPEGAGSEVDGEDLSIPLPARADASRTYYVRVDYQVDLGEDMGALGSLAIQTPHVLGSGEVPVGKVELQLWLPDGYEYVARRGNLHPRPVTGPDPWEPLKRRLWGLLGVRAEAAVPVGPPPPRDLVARAETPGADITLTIPEEGQRFDLQGYAPDSGVRFVFVGERTFQVIWGLLLLGSLLGGVVVARRQPRERWWWIGGGAIVALLVSWLLADALASLFVAVFLGGVIVLLGLVALLATRRIRRALERWRAERLELAPDPFLEEAGVAVGRGGKEPESPGATEERPVSPSDDSPAQPPTKDDRPETAGERPVGEERTGEEEEKPEKPRRSRPRKKKKKKKSPDERSES